MVEEEFKEVCGSYNPETFKRILNGGCGQIVKAIVNFHLPGKLLALIHPYLKDLFAAIYSQEKSYGNKYLLGRVSV